MDNLIVVSVKNTGNVEGEFLRDLGTHVVMKNARINNSDTKSLSVVILDKTFILSVRRTSEQLTFSEFTNEELARLISHSNKNYANKAAAVLESRKKSEPVIRDSKVKDIQARDSRAKSYQPKGSDEGRSPDRANDEGKSFGRDGNEGRAQGRNSGENKMAEGTEQPETGKNLAKKQATSHVSEYTIPLNKTSLKIKEEYEKASSKHREDHGKKGADESVRKSDVELQHLKESRSWEEDSAEKSSAAGEKIDEAEAQNKVDMEEILKQQESRIVSEAKANPVALWANVCTFLSENKKVTTEQAPKETAPAPVPEKRAQEPRREEKRESKKESVKSPIKEPGLYLKSRDAKERGDKRVAYKDVQKKEEESKVVPKKEISIGRKTAVKTAATILSSIGSKFCSEICRCNFEDTWGTGGNMEELLMSSVLEEEKIVFPSESVLERLEVGLS